MKKIIFQRGSIVSPSYLNSVQDPIRFSGLNRDNYYDDTEVNNNWEINYRDSIKDWEIDTQSMGALGRIAHSGRMLGYNTTSISENELEYNVVYGPPRLSPYGIGENLDIIDIELEAPNGFKYAIIEAGKIQLYTGEIVSWPRLSILLAHGTTNYIYFNGNTQELLSRLDSPPSVNLGLFLLAKVIISPIGELTEYEDLRPQTYIQSLYNYGLKLITQTDVISDNYTLNSWERIKVNTSDGSFVITMPLEPIDGDEVAFFDIDGTFNENPIILRQNENILIHGSIEDWIFNIPNSYVELYYVESENSWFFKDYPIDELCQPKAGQFISCGGTLFDSIKPADLCPDSIDIDVDDALGISLGTYIYEESTSKCYKSINAKHAVYADGEGGYFYEPWAPKCGATKVEYKEWINS